MNQYVYEISCSAGISYWLQLLCSCSAEHIYKTMVNRGLIKRNLYSILYIYASY